jgi:hypothetical protein
MTQLLPLLDLHPDRSAIILYDYPFDGRCENDLYQIGSAVATYHWRLNGENDGKIEVHDSSRIVEFGIYAQPITLNEPVLKLERGILEKQGVYEGNDSLSRLMADVLLTEPPKDCNHEVLNNIQNRRSIGVEILTLYRERWGNPNHQMHYHLANYKNEKMAKVIPIQVRL